MSMVDPSIDDLASKTGKNKYRLVKGLIIEAKNLKTRSPLVYVPKEHKEVTIAAWELADNAIKIVDENQTEETEETKNKDDKKNKK